MKKEIFEKLKKSKAVIKIDGDQFVYLLVNADGRRKPKLYNFVYNQHDKPVIIEVTDEEILMQIAEGKQE